jgi:hypothetical protein
MGPVRIWKIMTDALMEISGSEHPPGVIDSGAYTSHTLKRLCEWHPD